MKYDLVKSLHGSTESALKGVRTVQMLLPHLGHNSSQITAYVPVKRTALDETKIVRLQYTERCAFNFF